MVSARIAAATESDIPVILNLILGQAEYHKLPLVTATHERLRKTLFGPHPAAEVLLAFCESDCAGFALFFPTYSSVLARPGLYLDDLFVKPEWRGKGIGHALLKELAVKAVERDCGRLEWMVAARNESALRFYEKHGAVVLGDWKHCRMTEETIQELNQGK